MCAMGSAKDIRIILQARTDSSRLPGKALLPIRGVPTAVLAARRAANTGREVVLATSNRAIDDTLAELAGKAGIAVFRGDAQNVRARFLAASADLPDDATIVRLTADNMLPDGAFIEEHLKRFASGGYLCTEMIWSGVPYGLSAEVMRLGALRAAAERTDTPDDREHVTPALAASPATTVPPAKKFSPREAAVRCTLDTFDDYARLLRVFADVTDPIHISWRELLTKFTALQDAAAGVTPGPRLVLGTAQLAAPYGSATLVQPPSPDDGVELLHRAINAGAAAIDTARCYDGAEEIVGLALEGGWRGRTPIVTKLAPLDEFDPKETNASAAADAAERSVLRSLCALGPTTKPLLLLHRAQHLSEWDGAVWRRLMALRDEGLLAGLGVSVQNVAEAKRALSVPDVKLIQLPFNVLDWRWEEAGIPKRIAERGDVLVHVRSIYLQGILLRTPAAWPRIAGVDPSGVLATLGGFVGEFGRKNVADLCIAWTRTHSWIDGVVIGMERLDQLVENALLFSRPALSPEQAARVRAALPRVPETLLNPALWPSIR